MLSFNICLKCIWKMWTMALIHATWRFPLSFQKIPTPCASGQLPVLGMFFLPLFVQLALSHCLDLSLQVTSCLYSKLHHSLIFTFFCFFQSTITICNHLVYLSVYLLIICFLNWKVSVMRTGHLEVLFTTITLASNPVLVITTHIYEVNERINTWINQESHFKRRKN